MSRERPTELVRVVPDSQRGVKPLIEERKARQRNELDLLKRTGLIGIFADFAATMTRGAAPLPKFIRKGYEASIIDNLQDFYAARPRPWRARGCDSCKQTFKERLQMRRRRRNARQYPEAT